MDELIELIVRGILALISSSAQKKKPPSPAGTPKPAPSQRGTSSFNPVPEFNTSQNPRARQAVAQHAREAAQHARQVSADAARHLAGQRDQAMRQHTWRKGMAASTKPPAPPVPAPPPPQPRLAPAPARPVQAPPSSAPAITAPAIRQLIRSRPGSLRTIYALTEVLGQPLALRDSR